jgi:hypothetical protein
MSIIGAPKLIKITITPHICTGSITVDTTVRLNVIISPSNASDHGITWSSSNTKTYWLLRLIKNTTNKASCFAKCSQIISICFLLIWFASFRQGEVGVDIISDLLLVHHKCWWTFDAIDTHHIFLRKLTDFDGNWPIKTLFGIKI